MTTAALRTWRWWFDLATAAAFTVALIAPVASILAGSKGKVIEGEKRTLAPAPAPPRSWGEAQRFPKAFEQYFTDAHPWRATLTKLAAQAWREGFDQSFAANALLGRDGWMFFNPPQRKAYYHGDQPIDPWLLGVWKRRHQSANEWFAARGVPLLYVAVPEKQNIYPEHLPPHLRPLRDRPSEVVSYMRKHVPELQILDLEPILRDSKSQGQLYYRGDTHWNDLGAHVGYEAIIDQLNQMGVPVGPAAPLSEFHAAERPFVGDLAGLGLLQERECENATFYEATSVPYVLRHEPLPSMPGYPAPSDQRRLITERPDSGLPRAWIVRDSFSSALIPLLGRHFERAVWHWQSAFALDGLDLEQDRPSVAIHEANDRILWFMGRPYWEPQFEELWAARRFDGFQPILQIEQADWPQEPDGKTSLAQGDRTYSLYRNDNAGEQTVKLSIRGNAGPSRGLIVIRLEWDATSAPLTVHAHGNLVPDVDARLSVSNRTVPASATVAHLVLEHTDASNGVSLRITGPNATANLPRSITVRHAPNED